jgi:hypothetical protein
MSIRAAIGGLGCTRGKANGDNLGLLNPLMVVTVSAHGAEPGVFRKGARAMPMP